MSFETEEVQVTRLATLDRLEKVVRLYGGHALKQVWYKPDVPELADKTILVTPFGAYWKPNEAAPIDSKCTCLDQTVPSALDALEEAAGAYRYGGEELARLVLAQEQMCSTD